MGGFSLGGPEAVFFQLSLDEVEVRDDGGLAVETVVPGKTTFVSPLVLHPATAASASRGIHASAGVPPTAGQIRPTGTLSSCCKCRPKYHATAEKSRADSAVAFCHRPSQNVSGVNRARCCAV